MNCAGPRLWDPGARVPWPARPGAYFAHLVSPLSLLNRRGEGTMAASRAFVPAAAFRVCRPPSRCRLSNTLDASRRRSTDRCRSSSRPPVARLLQLSREQQDAGHAIGHVHH